MNTYKMNESFVRIIIGCCIGFTFKFNLRECKSVANILFIFIDSFIHLFDGTRVHSLALEASSRRTRVPQPKRTKEEEEEVTEGEEEAVKSLSATAVAVAVVFLSYQYQLKYSSKGKFYLYYVFCGRERERETEGAGRREGGGKEGAEYSE